MASGETNFASLPSKTSPSNADMFLLEDTEDTKKINYSALADAILNKLTSKTYSGLDTSAKNLVSALNELNSKSAIILNSDSATQVSFACKQGAKYFIVAQAAGPRGDDGAGPAVLTIAPNYSMDDLKVVTIFKNKDINPDITISDNEITMRFKTGDDYINFFKALIFMF